MSDGLLGNGVNIASLFLRGGKERVDAFPGVTSIGYGRLLSGVSVATITCDVPGDATGAACCEFLGLINPWAYEVVVERDDGRAWEGPVIKVTQRGNRFTIIAYDVVGWTQRRAHKGRTASGVYAVNEMDLAIKAAFAEADPNVLPFLVTNGGVGKGALMDREVQAFSMYYAEDLDSLADQGGNYTTVGRRVILFADELLLGVTNTLVPEVHLAVEPEVTKDGLLLATRAHTRNDNNLHGVSPGGVDPYYSLVETITENATVTSVAGLNNVATKVKNRSYPLTDRVSIPDGSTLSCDAPIDFSELVPGVMIPLKSTSGCTQLNVAALLTEVQVTQDAEGERIQITVGAIPAGAAVVLAGDTLPSQDGE